jgi:hypothetical protein
LTLTVTDPAEGITIQAPTTPVRGRVAGGPALLCLNGKSVPLGTDGSFATSVSLLEGENRLAFDVWPQGPSGRGSDLLPNTPPSLHLVRLVNFEWPSLSVRFTAPDEGAVVKTSPVKMAGLVSEPTAAVSVNGLPARVEADGRFTAEIPLVEGPNTLTAEAQTTPSSGNRHASAVRHLTYAPPTAPVVHILEPAEGLITNAAILVARGTVSDPASLLKVLGQQVAVAADGSWSLSILPPEGPFTLSAEATNPDGLTSSDVRHLVIDRTPPRIDLDANPPTPTRLTQLPLSGKVVDATPCQLWVEDASAGLTGPSTAARFSTSVPLAEGVNTLHFRAVDAAGNVGALVITVVRGTQGPGITLDPLPPDGECTLQVSGRAKDPTGVVTFTRDGVALPSADNAFAFTWSLNPGLNSTTLRATDALGNTSELSLTRTCTQPPPPPPPAALTLTVTSPQEGQSFTQPSAPVAGRVSDPSATVTVNGNSLPLASDGTFSGTVSLAQGSNLLTFSATTPSGQNDTAQRHVTYNPSGIQQAPVIVFDNPRDGYATSEKSLTILGHVDDPKAILKLQGKEVPLDAQGRFQFVLAPAKEGVVGVRAEAVNPYGTGRNAMYVSFQWSALQMAWDDPTPVEGSRLTTPHLTSAVTLSRAALVDLNGQAGVPEPNEKGPHPFRAQADLTVEEGLVVLTATAVDGGGNKATLARNLAVGLTAPVITFTAPAFDANGAIRTLQTGVAVSGTLTAPGIVKPLVLSLNGQAVPLDAQGAFSWTFSGLAFGPNPLSAVATNSFGQSTRADRIVERVQDNGGDLAPKLTVESPLEGFATGSPSLPVVGRVNQAGLTVKVQGQAVSVDPLTLRFAAQAELVAGANTLVVSATDPQGRSDSATIHGTRFEAGQAKYRWDLPANGARLPGHTVKLAGQADQPGIRSLSIHGAAMELSGSASSGAFRGSMVLPRGPQSLLLEALTVAGERLTERREVIIDPPLPRIRLDAPSSARPGDRITLTVQPVPGTTLASADLRWNGAILGHLQDPFPAQTATIPGDAAPGSKLLVEAIATDLEGESVTARTYVVVLAGGGGGTGGPLVWSVLDDRSGLVLPGVQVRSETGAPLEFGDAGLATLPALLPAQWVGAAKPGFTPQWRRGDQLGSKAQALFDARLTPLDLTQDAALAGFSGSFGNGAYQLTIPGGALSAPGKLSLTPLSTQGLPALLPKGWSAVSALWMQLDGATLTGQATLKLTPPVGTPESGFAWARFDDTTKAWIVLAINIDKSTLAALPLPNPGGYALVAADPTPIAPPQAETGNALGASDSGSWREGLRAAGAVNPSLLPTVEALNGARAAARLDLAFDGKEAVASGTPLLAEIVETYTRVDQSLIEPEKRAQDGVAARFVLSVDKDGAPALRPVADGLAMELPVRMSRTFQASELVEGLIQVGFYHEDQVIAVGGELIGTGGGSTTRDGVTAGFEAGAFAATTLVRVQGDPVGSWEALWPELKDLGRVATSFTVDLSGILQKGMTLAVVDLGLVPSGIAPILVQRRTVADQPVLVAVGAMAQEAGAWKLSLPAESNPILEGGAFAVLVPTRAWAWVTGTVSMPQGLAGAMAKALKYKVGGIHSSLGANNERKQTFASGIPAGDVPVKDALFSGNFLQAASGSTGLFALPAFAPATGKMTLTGQRWDLGLTGSAEVEVPSTGNALRLATIPFAIQAILPQESAVVDLSAVFVVLTTTPMDPSAFAGVKLFQKQGTDPNSTLVEIKVRHQLSMDGRTLVVTPDQSLVPGTDYILAVEGLKSLPGEVAPRLERKVSTAPLPPPPAEVDFTRISLGYPDASFNVTMTIPAGAIPAGASLLIEGLGMGYTYSGTMPNGELGLTVRASLGERIQITVQIGGRTRVGHVSRYEAGDGSGRVTIGVEGGRVEASDGSGAAVTFPVGSLTEPVELRVGVPTGMPEGLDPELAKQGTITARIRLEASHPVELKARPIFEFPAPPKPSTQTHSDNLGAYALFDRVEGFEEDNSPCVYYQLSDTAALMDGKLVSNGGLPGAVTGPPALAGRFGAAGRIATAKPSPISGDRPMVMGFAGGLLGIFMESFLIDSGPHYVSGFVTIQQPGQAEKPDEGAFIFFASSSKTLKRAGQLLQRTGSTGSYILASFLTDELVRGGGEVMAVDKDWGVRGFSGTGWGGPGGVYGTYYHAPTIHLAVTPTDLGDRVAPWLQLNLAGRKADGSFEPRDFGTTGEDLFLQVKLRDDRTREALDLNLDIFMDGTELPGCTGSCGQKIWTNATQLGLMGYTATAGVVTFTFRLKALAEGKHTVLVRAWDQACNAKDATLEVPVSSFGTPCTRVSNVSNPTARMGAGSDKQQVSASALIHVIFDQRMKATTLRNGVGLDRKDVSGSWVPVDIKVYGPNGKELNGFSTDPPTCEVVLKPNSMLEAGAKYRVSWGPRALNELGLGCVPGEDTFTVASWKTGPALALAGESIAQVGAAGGGRAFLTVLRADKRYALREYDTSGGSWKQLGVDFGPMGTIGRPGDAAYQAGKDFGGHIVNAMRVFEKVPTGGGATEDLLLLTTSPPFSDPGRQSVLWAYSVCETGVPKLRFTVSIGPGSNGYAVGMDQANGMISVARLTGSVAVISVEKAIRLWNSPGWSGGLPTPLEATEPAGACVGAIVQPFYLANPEDGTGIGSALGAGTHWSTAILGGLTETGGPSLDVLVGYSQASGDASGIKLSGLPLFRLPYVNGSLVTDAPYKGPTAYGAADDRTVRGPATLTRGAVRLAGVPGITVTRTTGTYATNLALGIVAGAPNGLPSSNKLVIVDEKDPANPTVTAEWPKENPFGQGASFELLRRTPLVDPVWKLAAIPVAKSLPGGALDMAHVTWCVLDLSHPETPTTVAIIPDQGTWGALYDRQMYLSQSSGGAVVVVDLRQAIAAVAGKVEGRNPALAEGLRQMAGAASGSQPGCKPFVAFVGQQAPFDIDPPEAWIRTGAGLQFKVNGELPTNAVTWEVSESNGGTVTASGYYSAPSQSGTFTVIVRSAADQNISLGVSIHVADFQIDPNTVTLRPGENFQFQATGSPSGQVESLDKSRQAYSAQQDAVVTWAVLGGADSGTINGSGVYTAPSAPGDYDVIATRAGVSMQAHILVERAKGITISPEVAIQTQGTFVVRVTLGASNGKTISMAARIDLSVGTHNVDVFFAGKDLRSLVGIDGPYDILGITLESLEDGKLVLVDEAQNLGRTVVVHLSELGGD